MSSIAYVLSVDTFEKRTNNAAVSKPETVRRIKSYSAATGFVYQYQFQDVHPAARDSASGNEYVYYVSADRRTMFPVRIFVSRDAVAHWSRQTGRALTGTEEYAIAKMRLFQAMDEIEDFAGSRPELTVEESNLTALLERLDL
ncbi:MAG: hypothetical protein ACRD5M_04335 [Candidatus Acidiferrales bacterium]